MAENGYCSAQSLAGAAPIPIVYLNVGGKLFWTTHEDAKYPDSLLGELCRKHPVKLTDRLHEMITIDRDPKGFEVILDIFRHGTFKWSDVEGDYTLLELSKDLEFYKLPKWTEIAKQDSKYLEKKTEEALESFVCEIQSYFDALECDELLAGKADFLPYVDGRGDIRAFRIHDRLIDPGTGAASFQIGYVYEDGEYVGKVELRMEDQREFVVASLGATAVDSLLNLCDRRGIKAEWVARGVPIREEDDFEDVRKEIDVVRVTW